MSTAEVALFFWVDDNPITGSVLGLKQVSKPRKDFCDYQVGEKVVAKCPGYGEQNAIIGKLGVEAHRKELLAVIKGPGFFELFEEVTKVGSSKAKGDAVGNDTDMTKSVKVQSDDVNPKATPNDKSEDKMPEINMIKRRKTTKPKDEAQVAKAAASLKKRQVEGERRKVMSEVTATHFATLALPSSATEGGGGGRMMETTLKRLEEKIDGYKNDVATLLSCRTCIKKHYKQLPAVQEISSPKALSKVTSFFSPIVEDSRNEGIVSQATVPSVPPPSPGNSTDDEPIHVDADDDEPIHVDADDDGSELTFLGDARYGIRIASSDLRRCEKAAKKPTKLGLNLIEFLLTKEEINTCTIYGNHQWKKAALDGNKRAALKSHIMNSFFKDKPSAEKEKAWEEIVESLNEKIRKLRGKATKE